MSVGRLNQNGLRWMEVNNQAPPTEGPRALPVLLDFSAATGNTSIIADLSNLMARTQISMIQTIFIDLSGTDDSISIVAQGTVQVITAKGRTQGYYNMLIPNPAVLQITCTGQPDAAIPIQLINVPIAGAVWSTQ